VSADRRSQPARRDHRLGDGLRGMFSVSPGDLQLQRSASSASGDDPLSAITLHRQRHNSTVYRNPWLYTRQVMQEDGPKKSVVQLASCAFSSVCMCVCERVCFSSSCSIFAPLFAVRGLPKLGVCDAPRRKPKQRFDRPGFAGGGRLKEDGGSLCDGEQRQTPAANVVTGEVDRDRHHHWTGLLITRRLGMPYSSKDSVEA
jgi:hypothetical protein